MFTNSTFVKKVCAPFNYLFTLFLIIIIHEVSSQNFPVSDFDPQLQESLAFPGAEGFGKFASGGRGGQILKVTNLNDSGPGSLREAIDTRGPRIIVFEVSGNIPLKSGIDIWEGNLTIAGQTAPGEGITIQNYPVRILGQKNIIIRYLRFRLGDLINDNSDAFTIRNQSSNFIIDHCSFSWGRDETASIYDVSKGTLQNCIISEGMQDPHNSLGSLIGGNGLSLYRNIWAHFRIRVPHYARSGFRGVVDIRNNVLYNWYERASEGGEYGTANFIGNYYKPGPATLNSGGTVPLHFFWPSMENGSPNSLGKFYLEGNVLTGRPDINSNQWLGVRLSKSENTELYLENLKNKDKNGKVIPFEIPNGLYSTSNNATNSYLTVLENAGASFSRDKVDERIVNEIKNGTVTFRGSKTKLLGIIDSQKDVGGWPALKSLPAPVDTDGDGIPDTWETANGLDPKSPNDKKYNLSPYYTDIEVYINSLVQHLVDGQNPGVPERVSLLLPSSNETVSPVDISFAWKPLSNAHQYSLQISKSSDFNSNVISINNIKNYSLVRPQLDANSTYFWRVRASNSSGNGSYSQVNSFKTGSLNTVPGRTILHTPGLQTEGIGLTPIFKWAKVPNASSYRIQVSTTSDFSTLVINQSNLNTTEYQSQKLLENRTYYWRVRATNSLGNGSNSSVGTFKTLSLSSRPLAVIPISPINKTVVSPINVRLFWEKEPSAEFYNVQLSTSPDFSNPILNPYNVTDNYLDISFLNSNTTYYWRVRGRNRSGNGMYSTVNELKTTSFSQSPQKVNLNLPENGANVFDSKITFSWEENPIAQSYRFQLSTSPNFNSYISNVGNLKNTSYTVSNLQSTTEYYWRVIANNEAGNSPASDTRKVRTASYSGTPGPTSLINPMNQTVVGAESILFEWENQPNTSNYRLEISEQYNFSTTVYTRSSITGTSFAVTELKPNKTYFWRVRTHNPAGTGQRSEIWSISTVDKNINLSPPLLLLPQKSSTFTNNNITFSWEPITDAASYHLQVSESADFSNLTYQNQNIIQPNFNLTSLSSGKAYYWRVRANKNNLFSAWSASWNFSVGSSENLLNNGLVGYWPMEEGSGNRMLDNSGNSNHATIQNTSNISWENGKIGKSIRLNGATERYGIIPHHKSLNIPNAITLAAWVKPTELQRGTIFYKNPGNGFELWFDIDGKVEFRLNRANSGTRYRIKSNFNYGQSLGKWIHVTATFDGSNSKIFINGKEDIAVSYAPFAIETSSGNLVIGAMGTIQRWRGDLDELRIYERALGSNEILMLYGQEQLNVSVPALPSNLLGHWKMDEGTGNKLIDHSGNENHATILDQTGISWSQGISGLALNLPGNSNRYANVTHNSTLAIANEISIAAWVKPSGIGRSTILSKSDGNGFELWLDVNGKIEFRLNRGNAGAAYKLNSNFDYSNQIGQWFHITATFDGSTSKIYINGKEDVALTYSPFSISTNSGDLVIGALGSIQRFKGSIDELRLYGNTLSEDEIKQLATQNGVYRQLEPSSKKTGAVQSQNIHPDNSPKELEEREFKTKALLYPNPVESQLQVASLWLEEGKVQVWVFDLKGSVLMEVEKQVNGRMLELELSQLQLKPGNYLLVVQDKQHREIFRFIKQ